MCSAKSSTWTALAGKRSVLCREGDGRSAVPLMETTPPVASRERTTLRCRHVLSTRPVLVDGLGCARDMRERGEGHGGRATEAREGGRVQVGDTAQGGRAEVHQCGTPGVVEHQRASEGEKGRVAYTEMTRLEGTTLAQLLQVGLFMWAQACHPPVSLFFLRRERRSRLEMALLGRGILGRCRLGRVRMRNRST